MAPASPPLKSPMLAPFQTYCTGTLSNRLGRSADWLYRNRRKLEAAGLPAPLPGPGHRRWDRAAVDRWLAGQVVAAPANDLAPLAEPEINISNYYRARAASAV